MDWLEDRGVLTCGCRWEQTHRSGDATSFVGQDVSKSVFCHQDIEKSRFGYHTHRSVVHIHVVDFDIRMLWFHFLGHLPPQATGCEHIGLVYDRKVAIPLQGIREGHLQNTFYLKTCITVHIVSPVVVLVFLTEVHATGKFPHADKVGMLHQFRFQWTQMQQAFKCLNGSDIGIQSELLSHCQKSLLGSYTGCGIVIESQIADSGEEHSISLFANTESILGERVTGNIDSAGTNKRVLEREFVAEPLCDSLHHGNALNHNLWSNTVARQNCDIQFHSRLIKVIDYSEVRPHFISLFPRFNQVLASQQEIDVVLSIQETKPFIPVHFKFLGLTRR